MEIKKIDNTKKTGSNDFFRPQDFQQFVWQTEIKKIVQAAISSAQKRQNSLWHMLFSWESWYGKTTLSQIIANQSWVNIKIIAWYAINKPAELISILNSLEKWDILFIDEIHRIRANIEEVLYIAMEDYAIDMVMPEWWNVRINLEPFTLIWATTKLESLSAPLKNRFIYKFHFQDYTDDEKQLITTRYLNHYWIQHDESLVAEICNNIVSVPREINNFCVKLRDYLISAWAHHQNLNLDSDIWAEFKAWAQLQDWWLSPIHLRYLDILSEFGWWPVALKTISLRLGLNEKAVEEDVEPLLMKLGKIDKTSRGRILR